MPANFCISHHLLFQQVCRSVFLFFEKMRKDSHNGYFSGVICNSRRLPASNCRTKF